MSMHLIRMQQVSQDSNPNSFLPTNPLQAGLARNIRSFSDHVPEEKLEPLRMEHFYLCEYVVLFRQFFNATINYYIICPHIIVLMMDGRQHFKTKHACFCTFTFFYFQLFCSLAWEFWSLLWLWFLKRFVEESRYMCTSSNNKKNP